ncbi:sigma-70 family RNA polymerase sigma factor [Sabulicella glaciei]|uniref:RNA polymerase sigma factor n=1 Tax=Sabulicella glaciei TaxID=2984948 RepID=A0ABT3NYF2_9PROT|nr:sigma-70 family RNA polymerase sigma factor [Roseococcus sp. MDT2-1-1]MCW8087195.1 sigma-70 family RNA polymerase sigma factor [Roseococcus sp. MDT2-1-1]
MDSFSIRPELPRLLPALRAYGRTLARSAAAADDLVQETILRALRAETQFEPGTELRAWLFTILRNVWLGQARKAGRERRALEAQRPEESRPASQGDRLELDELARAMAELPLAQREALMLVGVQGMTTAQVAEVVGVAEGTIKARVSRARSALRAALVHRAGPDLDRTNTHSSS